MRPIHRHGRHGPLESPHKLQCTEAAQGMRGACALSLGTRARRVRGFCSLSLSDECTARSDCDGSRRIYSVYCNWETAKAALETGFSLVQLVTHSLSGGLTETQRRDVLVPQASRERHLASFQLSPIRLNTAVAYAKFSGVKRALEAQSPKVKGSR